MLGVKDKFQNLITHTDTYHVVWSTQNNHIVIVCGESKQPCFIIIDTDTWSQLQKDINRVIRTSKR